MNMDQSNPTTTAAKPKRRWYQFNLKTLLLLPLVVGISTYWYDWRKHRPPYKKYDSTAFRRLMKDLKNGRLDDAYESTSAGFKKRLSRDQLADLVNRYCSTPKDPFFYRKFSPHQPSSLRHWSAHHVAVNLPTKVVELRVWTVREDSVFCRRPPLEKVESLQVVEFSQAEWAVVQDQDRHDDYPPPPGWEHDVGGDSAKVKWLFVELSVAQARQRLDGLELDVIRVQSAGIYKAVIVHKAEGQQLKNLEQLFEEFVEAKASNGEREEAENSTDE